MCWVVGTWQKRVRFVPGLKTINSFSKKNGNILKRPIYVINNF